MAKVSKKNVPEKSVEASLWESANKLRGSVEPSEYKHVVLSLIFLKFASDKFEEQRAKLVAEGKGKYADMPDFYNKDNVFYLDETSRWSYIVENARQNGIALLIDTALSNIEKKNKALRGALPDNYFSRLQLDTAKLSALISEIDGIDTLKDKDSVRIHGIISDGGSAVNVVPARATMEMQVRAKTPEAISNAAAIVDRCVKAAAMAFGGKVRIYNISGYMPYRSCPQLNDLHAQNLKELCGGTLGNFGHRGSSTDMGDLSMLMPALHAYCGGFSGSPHAKDFLVIDTEKAYIQGAKLLAMDAIEMLAGNAEIGREIAAFPPVMDKAAYLEYKEKMSSTEEYSYEVLD